MSSTQITAPIMVRMISRMFRPEKSSRKGRMLPLHALWLSGFWAARRSTSPFTSARPCAKLDSRFRRASTARLRLPRASS